MEPFETLEVNGNTVKLFYDDSPESPREWDNLGTMVCWHRRYNLGDKHEFSSPGEFKASSDFKDAAIVLPLFLYDHSGLRIKVGSFSGLLPQGHAEFDSGPVGYIFISREDLVGFFGGKKATKKRLAKMRENLESEVKTYDDYLSGQVYGYTVEDSEGNEKDSCWGFYGLDYARQEATAAAK